MSSTPIYDELAATYLADLIPAPGEPVGPEQPGEQAPTPAAQSPTQPPSRNRSEGLNHL